MSIEPIPVLVDTDIGSDIDDAIALAYLLGQERCQLVGITTVTGDVDKRAACAAALCRAAGRDDIPIRTGGRDPLGPGPGQPHVPHFAGIQSSQPDTGFKAGAVEFMRDLIYSRPGEIVLLSIGPFTNIATLFALDPEVPSLLRGYVSMGGTFPNAMVADWNPLVDPVAAAIAYRWAPVDHVSIGLDVTRHCRLPSERVRQALDTAELEPLLLMAEIWLQEHHTVVLHDPLAAVVIFRPEMCEYRTGRVTVDLCEGMAGATRFFDGAPHQDKVAQSVDVEAVENEVLSTCRRMGRH